MKNNTRNITLSAAYWVFVVYLFIPILVMMAVSFRDSRFVGFPIENWTLQWYLEVIQDKDVLIAFAYSAFIALASTLGALLVGIPTGLLLGGQRFWGWAVVFGLMILPAIIPGVISGISLRVFIKAIDLEPGTAAIILGHTIHNVPFVVVMVLTRLGSMRPSLAEAARDLGADEIVTFFRVTLPYLKPSLFGAFIFAILLSFDDFIRSFFLSGFEPTLPILIFSKLRSGMSPEINAISTLVLIVTAGVGLYAERYMRKLNG